MADRGELVALLLASQRSEQTRRAYELDLLDFLGPDYVARNVLDFVGLPRGELYGRILAYKALLLGRRLAPATVNRRLSTVAVLLRLAYRLDLSVSDGRGLIEREHVVPYRDVAGVGVGVMRSLLDLPDRSTVRGLRDRALLGVALELGLRNAEILALDVSHVAGSRLRILGKGRAGQGEYLDISAALAGDIAAYLVAAVHRSGALFRSLDRAHPAARLSAQGLRHIVAGYGSRLGVQLTVHQLRHSAVTAARLVTPSLHEAADFSRHADTNTLRHYDDARGSAQGQVSRSISGLLRGESEEPGMV